MVIVLIKSSIFLTTTQFTTQWTWINSQKTFFLVYRFTSFFVSSLKKPTYFTA